MWVGFKTSVTATAQFQRDPTHKIASADFVSVALSDVMKETTKAMKRRMREQALGLFAWKNVFIGRGIDVGSGDDPLECAKVQFNLPDGGGDDLTKFFPDQKFDFVHGSNVLEHAINPKVMLQSWIDCLHPRGYIIATVPDWELYEKKTWPSKFNFGHKTAWTTNPHEERQIVPLEIPIKLPEWLDQFGCDVILCRLIDTSNHALGPDIDQTIPPDGAEVFIEFVLKRIE